MKPVKPLPVCLSIHSCDHAHGKLRRRRGAKAKSACDGFVAKSPVLRMIWFECMEDSHSRPTGDFGVLQFWAWDKPAIESTIFPGQSVDWSCISALHTTDVHSVEWSTVIKGEVSLFMHWIFEEQHWWKPHHISAMLNHSWSAPLHTGSWSMQMLSTITHVHGAHCKHTSQQELLLHDPFSWPQH